MVSLGNSLGQDGVLLCCGEQPQGCEVQMGKARLVSSWTECCRQSPGSLLQCGEPQHGTCRLHLPA